MQFSGLIRETIFQFFQFAISDFLGVIKMQLILSINWIRTGKINNCSLKSIRFFLSQGYCESKSAIIGSMKRESGVEQGDRAWRHVRTWAERSKSAHTSTHRLPQNYMHI